MAESKAKRAAAAPAPAAKGQALAVGLNNLNPRHYGGFGGNLVSAEHDAVALAALAQGHGLAPKVLLGPQATRANVLGAVRKAVKDLGPGEMFLLAFAGLGGVVPNVTGDEGVGDKAWCLFDAQLIDKELLLELSRFAPGVRIFLVEDTCYSATVVRQVPMSIVGSDARAWRPRMLPVAVSFRTYRDNKAYYNRLQADLLRAINSQRTSDPTRAPRLAGQLTESALTLKERLARDFAPVLVALSAAQAMQTAEESANGGLFTLTLLATLQRSGPPANVGNLAALVNSRMPPTQSPYLWTMGLADAWLKQPLFSV